MRGGEAIFARHFPGGVFSNQRPDAHRYGKEGSDDSTLSRDVVIVEDVVRQAFNPDLVEARLDQQFQRLLLAPGRAQPFAAESHETVMQCRHETV